MNIPHTDRAGLYPQPPLMPETSPDLLTDTRPASPPPAGRFAFTTSADEDPFRPMPREHDSNGHYRIGPRLATPPLVRMIRERFVEFAPAREKKPAAERRRMGRAATRAAKGRAKPTGHAALAAAVARPRWAA